MKCFAYLLVVVWVSGCMGQKAPLKKLRRSVFKISTESQTPDYLVPWQRKATARGTGTGFYIGDNEIMTNAHVVANAKFITVQRDGDAVKYSAKVKFIAHDCDLAIIALDNPKELNDTKALRFGGLPKLQTPVSTIGYPTGGDQVSITEGVVSRIDYRRYAHSGYSEHLLIQVDSAINPGNSGGPVIQGGKVVGVAFQAYTAAENTGYIIPSAVINRFLEDIKDGTYNGHPTDETLVYSDLMSNPSMRAFYGIPSEEGVLVTRIPSYSPYYGSVKEEDVLLKVDGHKIGSDGKISFNGERVNFEVIFDLKLPDEKVRYDLIRDGKRQSVEVTANKTFNYYQAGDLFTPYPRYTVHGGFVFTTLSRNLIKSWGRNWYRSAPTTLRYFHYSARMDKRFEGYEEYIVLVKKLSAPINQYVMVGNYVVVKSINGQVPKNLNHFVELLSAKGDGYTTIDFHFESNKIVLPKDIDRVNLAINKHYSVEPEKWIGSYQEDIATIWKDANAH